MFAVQFDRFGPPDVLQVGSAAEPHAGPGEIRIRVKAAGVSPVDLGLRAGGTPMSATLALPHIPGVDAAGVVDEVGDGATGVSIGDEVFGSVDIGRLGGASAEFAILVFWAAKPSAMPWDQAAGAGTSIETATRALDRLGATAGMTLLIDGASGGVGSVAVQLALARAIQVIGTARAENQTFIAELGATPTTYGAGLASRVAALGPVDRALDVSGAGSLRELIAITGAPSAVLTLADFAGPDLGVPISVGQLAGEATGRHGLRVAAALFEQGRFRIPVQQVFGLGQAADAHTAAGRGPRRGKIILAIGG